MNLFDGWDCVLSLLFGLRPTVHPCLHQRLVDTQDSVSSWDPAPFSWLLVCTRFCLCPPRVCFPSPVEVLQNFDYNQIPLASKVKFPGSSQSLCWIPRLGNLLSVLELS